MAKQGRPRKRPMEIDGRTYWFCPCCDEWRFEDHFGHRSNASNGRDSWCLECRREDARMRRAISGTGELGDWRKDR